MAGKINEENLLKALTDLEALAKGDELQDADPEGGLSTEGTPLSSKAPKGKAVAKAAVVAKGKMAAASSSDGDSGDAESADASGDDASGGDDESGPPMGKSFREEADEDDTMKKAMEVSDFIESMVDQTSRSLGDLNKSLAKLHKSVDARIGKSEAVQHSFNARLAKAVVQIGNTVGDLATLVKSLANQPNVPQRKAVLSKSEVQDPAFGGEEQQDELAGVDRNKIIDYLVAKSMAGQMDAVAITAFEQSGYNPAALPPMIRKALVNDLVK